MISLSKEKILDYQKNRDPYLMIDYAEKIVPGKSAYGYKNLNEEEWFFKVHWENDPNMPGMLQIEALVQMCALTILCLDGNKGKTVYLTKANKLKFHRKILPNSRLYLDTELISYSRGIGTGKGTGLVNNKVVCEAEFNLVQPEELEKYKVKL